MITQSVMYACDGVDCTEKHVTMNPVTVGNTAYYPNIPNGWITVTVGTSQRLYCAKHVQNLLEAARG